MKPLLAVFVLLGLAACAAPAPSTQSVDPGDVPGASVCSDSIVTISATTAQDSVRLMLSATQWRNARLLPFERAPELANTDEIRRELIRLYVAELRDGEKGGTSLQFMVIDTAGVVRYKRLVTSTGYLQLDLATGRIVDQMRFTPARIGRCKAMSAVSIPIQWTTR